jgi:outer membrane receptor for ferrienterochelin and colicins
MALLCLSAPLHGQAVDYGMLASLFKEPVTTSVDGSPQRVSDVPATMEIITAEDIRRSGAKDIPGVLRHVGGIDTLEWGNDNMDVGIRGYDQAYSSRMLVLVDGRQVYADDFGYTPWSAVPISLGVIRQIEIIKGPSCALFGFNAVNGVINIITYNPLYDTMKTISVTGGTQELAETSVVAAHQFGARAAVRLSGGGNSDSDFSTAIPAFEEDFPRKHQNRGAINVDSVIRLNEATLFSIEASHSAVQLNEMGPDYSLVNAQYGTESLKGQLTVESRFGLLQATTYTNWLRETVNPGFADEPFYFNNRVTVAAAQDIFRLGDDHILRVAAEYRYNTEDSTPTTGASIHYNDFAVSGMWHWKITSRISLTNALRIGHLSLGRQGYLPPGYPFTNSDWNHAFTEPSFNTGLVWKPSDADSLRFMASRGVQLPSLNISGAYLISDPPFLFTGSPLIKPSAVTNYEIGWDHVMPGQHLLFRASAFRQRSDNIMSLEGGQSIPGPDGSYFVTSNIGSSDASGMELGLKETLREYFRWGVSYRPEWISDHFLPLAQNAAADVDYQHTTPVHLLKANLGWATNKWEIDGYLHYQSSAFGIQPTNATIGTALTPVAGFVSLDGRLAYNLTNRLTWSASGQNLTHASQIQTAGPAVERRVLGTMSFNF